MLRSEINSDKKFLYFLGAITLVGFFLRLHGLASESITGDEASALLQLKFPSFHAMIEGGVRPDVHPAFTETLLWFWIKCFGCDEFTIRLPFAIFGTASIWLAGIIGKKWFSNSTGLATAIGMAFLQFPLIYSQLARPYAPGLFFTLSAVYFWTQFVKVRKGSFGEKSTRKRDIAGFAIAAALAAYSHYFSLLTTTLIAVAGIFFVAKEIRLRYLLACAIGVLMFLPHLSITFSQMKMGGVGGANGWLGKPTPEFFMNHLKFAFDDSSWMMWGVFAVCALLFILFFRKPDKYQLLAILFWALPLIIGYTYSIVKNPLLQNSGLLFGFPFLLMFLFSRLPDFNVKKIAFVFPAGFAIVFFTYVTFYKPYHLSDHFGRFKELVTTTIEWQEKYDVGDVDVFYNVDVPFYIEYNCQRLGKCPKNILGTINNGGNELAEFRNSVENSNAKFFVYGWSTRYSPLEILPIIREKFPFLLEKKCWFNSAIYVFSKINLPPLVDEGKDILFHSKDTFPTPGIFAQSDSINKSLTVSKWSAPCKLIPSDTMNPLARNVERGGRWKNFIWQGNSVLLDSSCIYSPALKMKVGDILKNPDNEILFSVHLKLRDSLSDNVLVIQFDREGRDPIWNGMASSTQIDRMNWNQWQNIYFGLQLPHDIRLTDTVNFFCYSLNGKPILIDFLDVKTLKGHPDIYGPRADFQ